MTAITEQTRNANKASRGLNTIMANLAQVLDDSSSNGKKIIDIFDNIGISMYDANGQLKSGYDLLKSLASVWTELDNNNQKYVASTIAGTTQLNNFLALMNNFEHAIQATNTALNSAGSAIKENEAYMGGLEAKVSALKQTFEELANNIIDSDLVKNLLDVVNALMKFDNATGNIVSKTALTTGALWGGSSLLNVSGILNVAKSQFSKFNEVLKLTKNGTMDLGAALINVSTVGDKAGSVLSGAFSASLPVILAVAAALAVGGVLYKATEDYRKSVEELNSEIESDNEKLKSNKERIEEINALAWKDKTTAIIQEKVALEQENYELEKHIKLLGDIKTIQAAQTLQESGTYRTGESEYQVHWAGANRFAFQDMTFGSEEELNEYLADFEAKFGQTAQSVGAIVDKVRSEISATGEELYAGLAEEADRYFTQVTHGISVNSDQFEAFYPVAKKMAEAIKQLADTEGFDQLSDSMKELLNKFMALENAINGTSNAYQNVGNSVANYYNKQYALTDETTRNTRAFLDNIATLQVFNDTDLNVQQKISALYSLAQAAGYTTDSLNQMQLELEINRLIDLDDEAAKKAGVFGKGMKEITDIAMKNIWGGITKVTNTNLSAISNNITNTAKDTAEKVKETATNTAEDVKKAWEDYFAQQKSKVEEAKQAQEDLLKSLNEETNAYYDAEIEKLKANNEELEKKIEYEKLLEAMASARNKKQLVFKDGRFQYMSDMDAVAEAQGNLDAYNREKKLEDDIAALEKQRDAALKRNEESVYGTNERRLFTVTEVDENGNVRQYQLSEDEAPSWMLEGYGSLAEQQEAELKHNALISAGAQQGAYAKGESYLNDTDWYRKLIEGTDMSVEAPSALTVTAANAIAKRMLEAGTTDIDISDILEQYHKSADKYYGGSALTATSGKTYDYTSTLVPPIDYPKVGQGSTTNISVGNVDLPNVTNPQEFIDGLKNMALQRSYKRK